MRTVFVDTNYWVAFLSPRDQWHMQACTARDGLGQVKLVTSELILIEVLNGFSAFGEGARQLAAGFADKVLHDPTIETIRHTHDAFIEGLTLYEKRLDKGYSLIDCISMNAMRERGITEVLTHDGDFAQEGFTILM